MTRSRCRNSVTRRDFLRIGAGIALAAGVRPSPAFAADPPLRTRPIPRTGESLPVVGLGTAIIFDIGADAGKRAERRTVIQTMIEGRARLIDTAPSYGTAESVVGDLLAAMGSRDKVFLATKVRAAGREQSITEMRESLRRLRTDKLDLMQVHNIGTSAAETANQIATVRDWKDKGVFRYIGVTHFQDRANDRLIDAMQREKLDFVQLNYSLAERSVEDRLLRVAADTGTAVLVNLPFGRGKLFNAVRGRPLPEWAAEFDAKSWAQFFLKYLLAHEAVTCVMPGTDKPEYMLDNLAAGRGRLPDAAMCRKMVEYWNSIGA